MLKPDPGLGWGIHLVGIIWNEEIRAITAVLAILEVLGDVELFLVLVREPASVQGEGDSSLSHRPDWRIAGRNQKERSGVAWNLMPTKGLAALVQLKEKLWVLGQRLVQPAPKWQSAVESAAHLWRDLRPCTPSRGPR